MTARDDVLARATTALQLVSDYDASRVRIAELEHAINAYSPSGEVMPTDSLPGWQYLMGEDFNTDSPLGAWPYGATVGFYPSTYFDTSRNTGRPVASQGQYDIGRTTSVSGSVVRIRMHTEGTRPKVCALLPHIPGIARPTPTTWTNQTYGRYAVRARVRNVMQGYKIAWLLWPASNNSTADGEIDFPEQGFSNLFAVSGFVHHIDAVPPLPDQYGMPAINTDLRNWHTFVIEWTPGLIRFLFDGDVKGVHTERIPDQPMRWVLQCETAVSSTPPPIDAQGDIEIDWVAMWARNGTGTP